MFELAQELAVAESAGDVPAALALMCSDMVLETPAFGITACGIEQNERALRLFSATFPDCRVELTGHADDGVSLVCWGTA
ncbi:hypothetical protein [Nocardia arizonensis]|uniref:hypothetical protein n=1 Tax=Nocardia arizonensis TaxID=1141647 RepID=UPI0006D0F744|nr:hypothetical protein [Nocardia arizonensis]